MKHSCMRHVKKFICLLGVFSMALGCASTPKGHETFMAEGFRTALPTTGSRVVVRGNHSGAVNQAIPWLNDHQLLVVDRWVEKGSSKPKIAPGNKTDLPAQVQAVAHKVEATLVVFVQVNETPLNRTDSPFDEDNPMKMVVVEIQGINVETGEVAFGAKAWNSKPRVASEKVVQDLTILALEKAWQAPEGSLSGQQEVTPEIKTEQKEPLMTPVPVKPTETPAVTQPMVAEPTATSPERVTAFTEPVPEDTPPSSAVAQLAAAENSETSEDSSLGLQIASGALSILYIPFKVVYAGLGGLFGGFAYAVTAGNEQVAHSIWDASVRGTYWLTPDHLQGNEPVRFKGP